MWIRAALLSAIFSSALVAQSGDALKPEPGFDLSAIDRKTNPCDDFYQFACGTWIKNNPIPPDESSWGRFSELEERNRTILRQILEQAAARPDGDADTRKIGDYYASCMDEKAIDSKGLAPLQPELDSIGAMKGAADLAAEVARLHLAGANVLFEFSSGPDFKNSDAEIGQADQGGLGLPERDYYFRQDPNAVETRKEYVAYLGRMLSLTGMPAAEAQQRAEAVMALETELAKASLDVTSRRDPARNYHMMKLAAFEALAPAFDWSRYFAAVHSPPMQTLNVAVPEFFKGAQTLLSREPIDVWKAYLTLHLLHAQAMFLPAAFDKEDFAFYGKYLTGEKEQKARWKRCVAAADGDLGEALGKVYVAREFSPEEKARTLAMVNQIEAALGQDLRQLTWLTPETKQKAEQKLRAVTNKIGYPDKWRDYSTLRIERGDGLGNSMRASQFELEREIRKIGKPVDRGEWMMTPPTVNAYYSPQMNSINFPAGILQPPFFDKNADDATNFGGIGSVIGHELTHGFDDQGRQFGPKGNFENWWTPADEKAFEERVQCLVNEYSSFALPGGLHMNGKLTLGENTADNGGLRLAWMALMDDLAGKTLPAKDGFTGAQRFFLGFAQIWCSNLTDEYTRQLVQTNPHAVPAERVNGTVSNMPEFQSAFGCKAGQPMVRAQACRVW